MNTDGNYPPMTKSQWDSAPFNEKPIPEKEFEVCITQTLSKTVKVNTNKYLLDEGIDEDGHRYSDVDTSDTNWKEVYKDNHYTPLELIEKFRDFLKSTLQDPLGGTLKYAHRVMLIEECENWIEDETEIVEE
jgi:hypothetical protein